MDVTDNHDEAVYELQQLMERNRLPQAQDLLRKVLPKYPDSVDLLSYSLWIDWQEDRLDEAEQTISQVLGHEPDHYFARLIQARIYEERSQFAECEQQVLDLLREYPEDAELYALYSRVMLVTFNVEKAEQLAAQALKLDPASQAAMNASVLSAFVRTPGEEAQSRLRDLIAEHPDQLETSVRIIQMLIDQGQDRAAYEMARQLVMVQPDNEHIVELAQTLRASVHWSMKPMWPMRRFGWGGSIAVWLVVVALLRTDILAYAGMQQLAIPIAAVFIVYVIYSWVWPFVLPRLLR